MLSKNQAFLYLILILVLAASLRLYDLNQENLWTDEAFSVNHASLSSIKEVIVKVAETEAAPPGYYILLHYWVKTFGSSEFAVRILSAIFGILSIIVLFKLVRIFFERKTALLASLFMATSMLQVLYSQEARLYMMFTFLSLLSAYFFVKWYLGRRKRDAGLYFLLILISVYTNYLAVLLILLYTFVMLLNWDKRIFKKWVFLHTALFVLVSPLLPILLIQYSLINNGLSLALLNKGVPELLANLGISFFALPFLILFLFLLLFTKIYKRIRVGDNLFIFLLSSFGLLYLYLVHNPLSIFGINVFPAPITISYFLIRHPFFLFPVIYIYLAYKIVNMKSKKLAVFSLLFILLINSLALYTYYEATTKAEWKETASFIGSSELVLLDKGGFSNVFLLNYYLPEAEFVRLTSSNRTTDGRTLKQIPENNLLKILSNEEDFWLILAEEKDDSFKELLDKHYQMDISGEFYRIRTYHYKKRNCLLNE